MPRKMLISLFILFVSEAKSCLLHVNPIKDPDPWTKRVPRKLVDVHCECGKDPKFDVEPDPQIAHNYPVKPWHLYIHVKDRVYNSHIRTCTGTVINTKMLLTSSNCLRLENKKIPLYEAWYPAPRYTHNILAKAENIEVSRTGDFPIKIMSNAVRVVDIIYSRNWVYRNSNAQDDIAVIVLGQIWNTKESPPICIPREINIDPIGYKGYYYGVGGELQADPNVEMRIAGDVVVLPGKLCDIANKASVTSGNHPLCIQYRQPPPKTTGGPLIMSQDGEVNKRGFTPDKTAYLIGLASVAERKLRDFESTIVTTYFSNIIPLIPYVEYYADQIGAKWCSTPSVEFKESSRLRPLTKGLVEKYEWEGVPQVKRDESLNCVCGIHNTETSRISGGEVATPYEFPWLVFIFLEWTNHPGEPVDDSKAGCGGAIINDRMVLTAAHCVIRESRLVDYEAEETLPDDVQVFLRKHETFNDPKQIEVKVAKVYFSRDYVEGGRQAGELFSYDGDIALIQLETPLVFSNVMEVGHANPEDLRPICLPRPDKLIDIVGIKNAVVAGWGITGPPGTDPDYWDPPDKLMKLQVPILSLEECSRRTALSLRDSVICAGYFNRDKDSTLGDSGGPLAVRWVGGYWTEVGLVSFGKDEYDDNIYTHTVALYTNVQKYLHFVDYYSNQAGAKWCKSGI